MKCWKKTKDNSKNIIYEKKDSKEYVAVEKDKGVYYGIVNGFSKDFDTKKEAVAHIRRYMKRKTC